MSKVEVRNVVDDPAAMKVVEEIVARMRMALAPMMWEAGEELPKLQSYIISASAMMAGMTTGHMMALGALKPTDLQRSMKVITVAARSGIKIGKDEARKAMLEQVPMAGTA